MNFTAQWLDAHEASRLEKTATELGSAGEPLTVLAAHPSYEALLLGTASGKLLIFDPANGSVTHSVQAHSGEVTRIAFTPDGTRFLTTAADGFVHWWDHEFNRMQGCSVDKPLYAVAVSPNCREFAAGGEDKIIRVWDAETGDLLHTLTGHTDAVAGLVWVSNDVLVSTGIEGYVHAWQVDARRCFRRLRGHSQQISQILVANSKSWYATASWDKTIKVWNLHHREKFAFPACDQAVMAISLSEDDRLLAAGYWDGWVRLWNVETGKLHDEFRAHESSLISCIMLAGSQYLVSADQQGALRSWSIAEMGTARYVHRHTGEVYEVTYTPDNVNVLSASEDSQLKVWDRNTLAEVGYIDCQGGPVTGLAVSPDNRYWAIGLETGAIKIWDVEQQAFDMTLTGHKEGVSTLAFSPTGERLLSGSFDLKVRAWSLKTQTVECTFDGHNKVVAALDISLDGRKVVSAGWDATVRIWDLVKWNRDVGTELLCLEGHGERVMCCCFSPDGTRVASGSADQTIRVWSSEKLAEPRVLLGHSAAVTACRFTPDGRLLLTADRAGLILVWDAHTGAPLGNLLHPNPILCLAISPDGQQAVVGDEQGQVRFFELNYEVGPSWIAATTSIKTASMWKRGAPPVESHEVSCLYCGNTESIKFKQLGSLWTCGKCQAPLMVCPKALPAVKA